MGIWNILGIEPTNDISLIKKAYAAKLKIHHPEDDPEGYQKLREAYDRAVKLAKQKNVKLTHSSNKTHEASQNKKVLNDIVIMDENSEIVIPPKIKVSEEETTFMDRNNNIVIPPRIVLTGENISGYVNIHDLNMDFINKAKKLYTDFFARIDEAKWRELLNSDIMWNIDNKKNLGLNTLDFVRDHNFLPQNVWRLLDASFHWRELDYNTYSKYKVIMEYLQKQLNQKRPLSYDIFKKHAPVDFDKYLSFRDFAFELFYKKDTLGALSEIQEAKAIYADDPDLLCLDGRLLLYKNSNSAISLFDRALSINSNHVESLIQRANIYFNTDRFYLAAIDYKKVFELEPDNRENLLQAAETFYKAGKFEDAKVLTKKILELNPKDLGTRMKLYEINRILLKRMKSDIRNNPEDNELREGFRLLKKEASLSSKPLKAKKRKKYATILLSFSVGTFLLISTIYIYTHFLMEKGPPKVSTSYEQSSIYESLIRNAQANVVNNGESDNGTYDESVFDNTNESVFDLGNLSSRSIPPEVTNVKGFASNVTMINLEYNSATDSSGKNASTFSPLFSNASKISYDGWVYVGKIGNKEFIIVSAPANLLGTPGSTTYNFTSNSFATIPGPVSFTGTLKDTTPQIMDSVKSQLDSNELAYSYKNLVTDKYIVFDNSNDFLNLDSNLTPKSGSSFASLTFLPGIIVIVFGFFVRSSRRRR